MARKFKVEIVSPEKVLFAEEAESLVIPAERGYLGILASHAPLLASLRAGEIRMTVDGVDRWFATSGGFVEVTPEKTTLLVDSAEPVKEIDVPRAQEALKRAEERLASTEPGIDRDRARLAKDRAQNRLRTASKRK